MTVTTVMAEMAMAMATAMAMVTAMMPPPPMMATILMKTMVAI
jgi:hypothetical protein